MTFATYSRRFSSAKGSALPPGPSPNPELSDWVARVQGQGSDVSGAGVQAAVATFISAMKSANLLSRALRIGVYAGDSLAALKAPLIKVEGAATDTLTNFVGADYSPTGLTGGATKHIETGYSISGGTASIDDFSIGLYVQTPITTAAVMMGAQTAGDSTRGCYLYQDTGQMQAPMWDTLSGVTVAGAPGVGFFISSRIASNNLKLYKNGVQFGLTQTAPGSNVNFFSFRVHDGNLSNAPQWAPTSQTLSFYWIGLGISGLQQITLRAIVQNLQTALGRAV